MALTPRPVLHPGVLALYHGVNGHRVKVQVKEVRAEERLVVRCVVTARKDTRYGRGEVIWTSPTWLSDRRGYHFVVPSQRETEVA